MRLRRTWLTCACIAVAASAAGSEPPCRISLQLEPGTPFVEQAVQWRLQIESRAGVDRVEWIDAPAFPGARAERVTVLPATPQETGWLLRREERVVFPERAGRLVLPAARLACGSGDAQHELRLAPHSLAVLPLPETGRPPGFSGLVGAVTLRRYLRPETLALGGTARVTVSLRGEGNVWAAADPHRDLSLEDTDVFRLPAETGIERSGGLRVTRVYAADVVPRRAGRLRLPALRVSWFDPLTGRYEVEAVPALELPVAARPDAELRTPPAPAPAQEAPHEGAVREMLPAAALWIAARFALVLGVLATVVVLLRRRRAQHGSRSTVAWQPSDDPAAQAERAIREALATHLPEAARLTPTALLARADLSPDQRAAAELLVRAERARFDRNVAPPPTEEVARRIEALRSTS